MARCRPRAGDACGGGASAGACGAVGAAPMSSPGKVHLDARLPQQCAGGPGVVGSRGYGGGSSSSSAAAVAAPAAPSAPALGRWSGARPLSLAELQNLGALASGSSVASARGVATDDTPLSATTHHSLAKAPRDARAAPASVLPAAAGAPMAAVAPAPKARPSIPVGVEAIVETAVEAPTRSDMVVKAAAARAAEPVLSASEAQSGVWPEAAVPAVALAVAPAFASPAVPAAQTLAASAIAAPAVAAAPAPAHAHAAAAAMLPAARGAPAPMPAEAALGAPAKSAVPAISVTLAARGAPQAQPAARCAEYGVGAAVQVLRSSGLWTPATILGSRCEPDGYVYDVQVDGGNWKAGVPAAQLKLANAAAADAITEGTAGTGLAACPAPERPEDAAAPEAGLIASAALAPLPQVAPTDETSTSGCVAPRRMLRVQVGRLEFEGSGGLGFQGLLESAGFRVTARLGGRGERRFDDGAPMTSKQELRYTKTVSENGNYGAVIGCSFDEALDLAWPPENPPEQVAVDIWLERQTVVEQFDRLLDAFGFGNGLPEFDRIWVGRAVAQLPPDGVDAVPFAWPVLADAAHEGPLPKSLSLGVEWVML
eukprot:TRINITY_DN22295_c0_g1_i1.p1 TRINITY_DN22295_c0_g1~~TRINITY_DN22295_c0_g1_i1.p1  ORF type:complete len:598 (-),score=150.36 TRINITY_DN22295_c0_g1_i1:59-1852(-)